MANAVEVRPVSTRRERKAFIQLPWRLYASDPFWVAPLRRAVARTLDPQRNPFYEHGESTLFLAWQGGRPVGRIAATVDFLYNSFQGETTGFWGFFETERDPEVARALLSTAADCLRERGMTEMRGPFNPSINSECGLLVEGFNLPPAVLMPYNPAYYPDLVEHAGLDHHKDLCAYFILAEQVQPERKTIKRLERLAAAIRKRHPELHVRPLDLARYDDEILVLGKLFNEARKANWGFVPMTDDEIRAMARDMRPIADPELTLVAELRGEPVGCLLGIPDVNPILQKLRGRLFPFGWLRFLWARRRVDRARIFGVGTLPEYRNLGVTPLLMTELIHRGLRRGYKAGELSWVAESNFRSLRVIEHGLQPRLYKRYRVYSREL